MEVPSVNARCCGCSLRTRFIIMGSLWTVSALGMLVTFSVKADAIKMLLPDAKDDQAAYLAFRVVLIMFAVLACAQLIVSIGLIYGSMTYKMSFILFWVVSYIVIVIIYALGYLSLTVIFFVAFNVGSGFTIMLVGVISCALTVYCIIVVKSHYRLLKQDITQYP